jgi:hypothetical protein
MENGTSLGTYVAYGLIVLFWIVVAAFLLRTIVFASLLLLQPLRNVFGWLRGSDLARGDHVSPEPPRRRPDDGD